MSHGLKMREVHMRRVLAAFQALLGRPVKWWETSPAVAVIVEAVGSRDELRAAVLAAIESAERPVPKEVADGACA